MEFLNQWVLPIILAWPLVSAVLALLANDERTIKWGSTAASLLPLGLSIYMLFAYDFESGGMQFEVRVPWIESLGASIHLGADGLSVPLVFLTALLSTLSIYYSARVIRTRVKEYFVMFHLLELSMLGVFVALDYILFYVFWEISLVPMYLLIGIWGGAGRSYASIKFFIYTLVGSVAMLLAILLTYFATGTFDIIDAAAAQPFMDLPPERALLLASLAFWGFFLGFAFKVPSFPFHTWLPDAHTEAPTAGSVILAGVLLKLGAYGFLRIVLPTYPAASEYWSMWLVALGAIAIVYGAFVCVAQTDLKRLIAYSSVSHMGYVMLGIGAAASVLTAEGAARAAETFNVSTEAVMDSAAMALNGATLQMFNHGIITGALFFLVGVIYERAHTRALDRFGGLSTLTPYYYGVMLVAGFASLGLPGLAGFWAEFFTFRGAFALVPYWAAFGAIGIIITAVYILWRIIQNLFLGTYDPARIHHWTTVDGVETEGPTDMAGFEKVTLWPLLIGMVVLGIYPPLILNYFNGSAVELLEYIQGLL
ncbi:MAG TPA: NADH-quinone oxidoreductase subunit M [Caldilineaceae bacterium]|nr:NADH-quinone oxidoreductase subunit M [Caldilineaceae bacterium]